MRALRTPDDRFENLPGYTFAPHYVEVPDGDGGALRVHYLDEGPADANPSCCMHGEPSWAYLYRKMIPVLTAAGYRAVAPDLVGLRPLRQAGRARRLHLPAPRRLDDARWLDAARPAATRRSSCQDWGGLIGLRLVAEHPDRFARVVAANTFLPTGDAAAGRRVPRWQRVLADDAELPRRRHRQGRLSHRARPRTSSPPTTRRSPTSRTRRARASSRCSCRLARRPGGGAEPGGVGACSRSATKPFLTRVQRQDPITRGADRAFQARVPGTKGQPHTTIEGGGHFLQEDKGEELANVIVELARRHVTLGHDASHACRGLLLRRRRDRRCRGGSAGADGAGATSRRDCWHARRSGCSTSACEAERLGYDSFWTDRAPLPARGLRGRPERHPVRRRGSPRAPSRIRIGTMFNVVPQWHPLRLAEDFATLHNLSGGRAILGVGRGTVPREVQHLNDKGVSIGSLRQPRPGRRRRRSTARCSRSRWRSSGSRSTTSRSRTTASTSSSRPPGIPDRGATVRDAHAVPRPRYPYEIWQAVTSPPTLEYVPRRRSRRRVLEPAPQRSSSGSGTATARCYAEPTTAPSSARGEKRMLVLNVRVEDTYEEALDSARPGHDEFWKFLGPYGWSRGYMGDDGKPVEPGLIPTLEESIEQKTMLVGHARAGGRGHPVLPRPCRCSTSRSSRTSRATPTRRPTSRWPASPKRCFLSSSDLFAAAADERLRAPGAARRPPAARTDSTTSSGRSTCSAPGRRSARADRGRPPVVGDLLGPAGHRQDDAGAG